MSTAKRKGTLVRVTRADMAAGEAGDCFRCAVAIAMHRATGDDHANVYERDGVMYLEAWGRHIVAPCDVRLFVWAYDDLPRDDRGRVELPDRLPDELKPFSFTLPTSDSDEWQEQCCQCEELRPPAELDDEGVCEECQEECGQ